MLTGWLTQARGPCWLGSQRFRHDPRHMPASDCGFVLPTPVRTGLVSAALTARAHTLEPAGGEQAANALQRDGSSRHAMAAKTKVRGMIKPLRLVTKWRYLRSHDKDHGVLRALPPAKETP
jgi:hypothetical protein